MRGSLQALTLGSPNPEVRQVTASRRSTPSFPEPELEAFHRAKILGVRAGEEHRYTGVWVVVVEGRVFVRSWNDEPTGWYRAFRRQPLGTVSVAEQELPVRALPVRSQRLRHAVTEAYASKYDTKASEKWVRGFAEPRREATTLELVPAA
ncbi:MAG: DUF2255 family protein [Longimicrobiaceae bacterium]